ncbi:hypothetical protein Tco_0620425 [Tanacetum coccineum]
MHTPQRIKVHEKTELPKEELTKSKKIALSISKLKAARYIDFGLKNYVPSMWFEVNAMIRQQCGLWHHSLWKLEKLVRGNKQRSKDFIRQSKRAKDYYHKGSIESQKALLEEEKEI